MTLFQVKEVVRPGEAGVERERVTFRRLWRVGEFRALWSAELLSVFGDQLARVALSLMVFEQTSSAMLTGLTYALTFVPSLLGGLLLSGLADRFPRRQVIITTDVIRALLAAAMAIPALPLSVLWVLVGVLTLASAPFKAAQLALLPDVLDEQSYPSGVALRQGSMQVAQIVGFGAGGALVAAITPPGALLINSATFVASAILVAVGVRSRPAAKRQVRGPADVTTGVGRPSSRLTPIYLVVSLTGLFVVPEGLAAPYADALGTAAFAVGVLMAADPVGSVLGAWLATRLRDSTRLNSVLVPALLSGLPLVVCFARPGLVISALLWALSGALSTIYLIRMQPYVVANVADDRRGGVMGRLNTALYTSQGVAILGGGAFAEQIGPFAAVAVAGGLGTLLIASIWLIWGPARPRRPRADEQQPVGGTEQRQSSLLRIASSRSRHGHGTPTTTGEDAGAGAPPGNRSPTSMNTERVGEYPSHRATLLNIRQWELWSRPRPAVVLLLGVDLIALVATALVVVTQPVGRSDLMICAILIGLGLLAAEMSLQVERMRRLFSDTPHVNLSSVWTFAAALLLPPPLAAVVVCVLYGHLWVRIWRKMSGMHAFRVIFNIANVLLCCYVSAWFLHLTPLAPIKQVEVAPASALWLAAVIVVYFVVNSGILAAVIALLRTDRSARQLLGRLNENILEFATLCMGGLTALLLAFGPWFVFLVYLPLYALHRSVLIRQYEHAATTDSKTGLLNMTSWRSLADRELDRARRQGTPFGVLMIDIDHFRRVNNEHGHLVGDRALQAVADSLKHHTRSYDLCGRFGGEEFVVLLPETDSEQLLVVAERIRKGIRELRIGPTEAGGALQPLSVSIGAAAYPLTGQTLEDLLLAADNGLFAAKSAGRDQVRTVHIT